ncbi:MAG: glycosyltransferase family 39 protein [Armatimonadetes bacterium]|nr:glycosyltransferase family 39 protein [Armatimonadota bacterium]
MDVQAPVEAEARRAVAKGGTVVAVVLLAVTTALFAPLVPRPLDGDPALYAYVGDRLLHGDGLYKDVWDVKPPGFPFLYSAAFAVFGRHMWAPALLDALFAFATAAGVFVLTSRYAGRPGSWCAALFALVAYWGVAVSGLGLQAEGFAAPFLIWAFVLRGADRTGWAVNLLSGALLAYAVMVKTPLAVFAIPWTFLGAGKGRNGPALVGAAAVFGAVLVYLKAHHAVSEAAYTLFEFAGSFVAQRTKPPFDPLAWLAAMAGGLWLVIIANWAGVVVAFKERSLKPVAWAVLAALALTVYQGAYWSYHWYLVNVFAAVGVGVGFERLTAATKKPAALVGGLAAVILVALNVSTFLKPGEEQGREPSLVGQWARIGTLVATRDWDAYAAKFLTSYGDPPLTQADMGALAKRIAKQTSASDTVWTTQMPPTLSFLAERREPVRFIYPDGLEVQAPRRTVWTREFIEDIVRKRPAVIVVARVWRMPFQKPIDGIVRIQRTPVLGEFFAQNYELETSVKGALDVYRLKRP